MGVNLKKTSHIILFAVVLPAASFLLAWIFHKALPNLPFWVETLSPLAAYGLLYAWFENNLWKLGIFKAFGVVSFPDLRGRWRGSQRSSYIRDAARTDVPAFLEINQTFSKIKICAYYERSQSSSIVANFAEVNDESFLFYSYDNEPNSLSEGSMQIHKGTVKLRHLSKENKLLGMYFNSIGNHGEMSFDFESYDMLCRFNP